MSIEPIELYPPQPVTVRAQSTKIAYDAIYGRIAYAMGRSIFVRPIDADNAKAPAFQFTKHTSPTTVAAFSPSGMYIASGDESGQVKIWDTSIIGDKNPLAEQPYIKSEFQILSGPIKSISWDADNSRIIAVGEGKEKFGHCFSWDSGNSIGEIQGHSDVINDVDIKGQRPYRPATVGNDKALVFYTGPPFKFDKSIRDYHTNVIRGVKFSPDGKYLISVGSDRLIVIYDGKTGEYIQKIENAHEGGIFGVSWFKDSSKFATCSADNKVKVWSADTFEAVETLSIGEKVTVANQLVSVVVTDKSIISLSVNGNLNYYQDGKVTTIEGHQSSITASLKLDGIVITGGSNGKLFKWEIVNDKLSPIAKPIGDETTSHGNYVVDIISAGKYIVTIGWDDKLKVWDEDSKFITEVKLDSQPKKLLYNNSNVTVLFEDSIVNYSVGSSIEKVKDSKLSASSSDVDYISEKLLTTNLTENKIDTLEKDLSKITSNFTAIRGTPSIIRVSPNDEYVALGDSTGKYIIYNADSSVKTTRWSYQTSKILDAKWSSDSNFLLTGGLDSGIFIYSISKIAKVLKLPLAHQTGISRVEWLSYEDLKATILTTGLDGSIKLWKVDLTGYM